MNFHHKLDWVSFSFSTLIWFHKVKVILYHEPSGKSVRCVRDLEVDVRLPYNNKHPVSKFLLKLHSILRLSNLKISLPPFYILYIKFSKQQNFDRTFCGLRKIRETS